MIEDKIEPKDPYVKLNPITDAKEIKKRTKATEAQAEYDMQAELEIRAEGNMVEGERIFRVPGQPYDAQFEIKWFKDGKRRVKVKIVDIETDVERDDLMTILFTLANRKQRRDSATGFLQLVKHFTTIVGFKAQTDIKKGEEINAEITIPLPVDDDGRVMTPDKGKNLTQVI